MKVGCLSTRFLVPQWWVTAYESALIATGRDMNVEQAMAYQEGDLAPSLSSWELDVLAVLLNGIQDKILSGEDIVLDPRMFYRRLPSLNAQKLVSFERVFQNLGALRLFTRESEDKVRAVNVFTQESWTHGAGGHALELVPSALGTEVLLGLRHPYLELVRWARGECVAKSLMGTQAPLALWQSTWLDLSGYELGILLRLEKAMQWDFHWLALDGVFGVSIAALMQGLDLPRPKKMGMTSSPLQLQMAALEKVGKKLVDHGMLQVNPSDEYLALTQEAKNPLRLVWQLARDRVFPEDTREYRESCERHLYQQAFKKNFTDIVSLCAGSLTDESLMSQCHGMVEELEKTVPHYWCSVGSLDANAPLPAIPLFIEWLIRQLPGHSCPLPEEFRSSAVAQLTRPSAKEPLVQRFKDFCQVFEDGTFMDSIRHMPMVCLASERTAQEKSLRKFVQQVKKTPPPSVGKSMAQQKLAEKSQTLVQESLAPIVPQQVKQLAVGHIRKVALEELNRLRFKDRVNYIRLKTIYFESLDNNGQRMFKEIELRCQPKVFEDQIQQSLIKFMVEHTNLWHKEQYASKVSP